METIYKVQGLEFAYFSKPILNNLSIEIKKGSFTGILGPNGSGKSTLLKNMLNYLNYSNGDIFIKNKDIKSMDNKNIAKIVSYIPQKSNLTMNMTVYDVILMGRFPHLKSKWVGYSSNDYEMADNIIEQLGIAEYRERAILGLSGGEFQRVLLARALVQNPEIILLDEATSNLDINHSEELMTLVKKMTVEKGITAIAVLHDLNLASAFCTDIAFLKAGKVKYYDKPNKLFKREILKDIYDIEPKILEDRLGNSYIVPKFIG